MRRVTVAFAALLVAGLASCGAESAPVDASLSPVAAQGQQLVRSSGCGACHGPQGQGSVGPAFVGLFGSEVQLDDGSTIDADEAYLTESITDPGAKRAEGYRLNMPTNSLGPDEVASVVAYIVELAGTPDTTP